VDENRWLSCADAAKMLTFLQGKASDRKLRLFVCACCRDVAAGMDEGKRRTLALVERVAEGQSPLEELLAYYAELHGDSTSWVADPLEFARRCAAWAARIGDGKTEARRQPHLLRCLFGNPFRPLPARSFPAHVLGLAKSIYAAFPDVSPEYAILADALEELGAAEAAAHCRTELHAKGCHVLDWITGRE
jgi:hypothetical protein